MQSLGEDDMGEVNGSRRSFLKSGATIAALGVAAGCATTSAQVLGANERLNVAVMGVRSRGKALIFGFAKMGARVTHIIDVDTRVLDEVSGEMVAKGLPSPKLERDVRKAIEDKDLDALVIAAPDHWHAPAAIMALAAGKHVYLEKPSSHSPREDELLITAQEKYGKVVQMGNQQRSAPESIELMTRIGEGEIGEIYQAETWYANNRGSIGNGTKMPAPNWLDWELWQGPAPRRDYQDNLVHYNWHWFWHWGTGETCNNAAHELDIARWAMGLTHPIRVSADGSRRFHTGDDWEMYDTMELKLDYEGDRSISWSGHSCNKAPTFGRTRGTQLLGTKGWAIVDRSGYEIYNPAGERVGERKREATSAASSADLIGADELTDLHIGNFIDTVRGKAVRQASPIQDGAVSTLMCHLGNLAYRTDGQLRIDPESGRPMSDRAMALWAREYHEGWAPEGA
jgi:predicted dehydrogenase